MAYTTITIEGGLFPSDLLDRLVPQAGATLEGQKPADFGCQDLSALLADMQAAFNDMRTYWESFQRRLQHASGTSHTSVTRESWVLPVLELLGFAEVRYVQAATAVGQETYNISHFYGDVPIHIVGCHQQLDQRLVGRERRSPHSTVQEYLNRSDALWGIVTNGLRLRLLRDSALVSHPVYLEFDLEAMVRGELYSEFVLLYRLLHSTRFPRPGSPPNECLLERYYQQGIEEGGRVRERLREGVERALGILGRALLAHPESVALREAMVSGELSPVGYYRELLRLIYRLLFLFVVEERRLLLPPAEDERTRRLHEVYLQHYSASRLRARSEAHHAGDTYCDLWHGLMRTFELLRDDERARKLGMSALNGELFGPNACAHIERAVCTNQDLLDAIASLTLFQDEGTYRRVNFAWLDVEELGSVYESLLDYHPRVEITPAGTDAQGAVTPPERKAGESSPARIEASAGVICSFELVMGSERKQTGSYYTPPSLVRQLIKTALEPVIEQRLKEAGHDRQRQEEALLNLRVCDPASGSGHFLLAAARRIARELARVRTGEEEPSPQAYRQALRDVIRECIYAVDKNPLAVDLCKVALWIEGYNTGMPLSFLDNHIKCGDSLVGIFDIQALVEGVPDGAYEAVEGDSKAIASAIRKRNKEERLQSTLWGASSVPDITDIARDFAQLSTLAESTPEEVRRKEQCYSNLRKPSTRWWDLKVACDLWTYAFFAPLRSGEPVSTTTNVWAALERSGKDPQVEGQAIAYSQEHPFFHWPLEFPEVFDRGGFDVVLGNPPWERLKLQQQEFFASRDLQIAKARNKAERNKLIKQLPQTNPELAREYDRALHASEAQSKFVRLSGRFPLCGRGDVNTYSVFAENFLQLMSPKGRAGLIVPTGIATDDTNKHFFAELVRTGRLASLYDFENKGIFPAVDDRYKFCLLTLGGDGQRSSAAEFAFFLHSVEELEGGSPEVLAARGTPSQGASGAPAAPAADKRFILTPEEISLINPNTRTCPIFRSRRDAELTLDIYRRVPVLVREGPPEENPWGVSFLRMFDMSNDSHLFRTRGELEAAGYTLVGNVFVRRASHPTPRPEGDGSDGPAPASPSGHGDPARPTAATQPMGEEGKNQTSPEPRSGHEPHNHSSHGYISARNGGFEGQIAPPSLGRRGDRSSHSSSHPMWLGREGVPTPRAREFRRASTRSKELLWHVLRGLQVDGYRFRRQHPFGPFILEFYCPEARLAIEVDGPIPGERREVALERQRWLERHGLQVIRVSPEEVEHSLPTVVRKIRAKLSQRLSQAAPLPGRSEDGHTPSRPIAANTAARSAGPDTEDIGNASTNNRPTQHVGSNSGTEPGSTATMSAAGNEPALSAQASTTGTTQADNSPHAPLTSEEGGQEEEATPARPAENWESDDVYLPLYEGKMLQQFNHRWATYQPMPASAHSKRMAKTKKDGAERNSTPDELADPNFVVIPQYWVAASEVSKRLSGRWPYRWLVAFRDITNSTNERTAIFSFIPRVAVGNTAPLVMTSKTENTTKLTSYLANTNSFLFDYVARQKVGGTHLTFTLLNQFPVLPPSTYERQAPWDGGVTLAEWITPRVMELVYTAWDLRPFAQDMGYDCPPFRWDKERRFILRCELDAAYFHLYGIRREDVDYIMETFPIVRRRDMEQHGEYRTKRVILEIYDEMERCMQTDAPYTTRLHPPPADPSLTHPWDRRAVREGA
ncbi:protein of unknown function DUF559 [Thermobaculum terrenum ATCC BAA-798]|uniref:site-specific DNA-methyltransferase (adenine-specific) n=1 Tax=Thermobaculum terrenum (strain ATCC BAA-798 / CCMEE 7001 / YNP1) TaxID=525904 RepID=D1CIG6_THET1|nr:DUF559 domain-containing protein [Thermobaculum terrenum]ACZ43537.1 protein of unknown function DUF559 [Thermobaculum terrenum ATCC BAA-798]